MNKTIKFPHDEDILFETGNPIAILGTNGFWETRFKAKIEIRKNQSHNG